MYQVLDGETFQTCYWINMSQHGYLQTFIGFLLKISLHSFPVLYEIMLNSSARKWCNLFMVQKSLNPPKTKIRSKKAIRFPPSVSTFKRLQLLIPNSRLKKGGLNFLSDSKKKKTSSIWTQFKCFILIMCHLPSTIAFSSHLHLLSFILFGNTLFESIYIRCYSTVLTIMASVMDIK